MSKDARIPPGRALIVGLGNPGSRYAQTRHNIGFDAVLELARRWSIDVRESRFKGIVGAGVVRDRPVALLLPQTYMNLSGESVQAAAAFYKLEPASVIVAHDDIDLPPGKVKLKLGGGHGGHNGLRSTDQQLGSREYLRVRLGVGRPPHPAADVSAWVLGRFAAEERATQEHLATLGADAIEALLTDGLLEAQGKIHPVEPPPG